MKTVEMIRDFNVHLSESANRTYSAGRTYRDVLENHAQQIVKAGAGRIVDPDKQSETRDGATASSRRRQPQAPR